MSQIQSVRQDMTLATTLAHLGDDTLIDASSIAALLCLTPASARQAAYRSPDSFPPRFPTPSRHLRWRLGDVREWIRTRAMLPRNGDASRITPADREVDRQTPEKEKKPGKSRKAEQVRLQKLGEKIKREQSATSNDQSTSR